MSVDMKAVQQAAQSALDAGTTARDAEAEAKYLREKADLAQVLAEEVIEYEVKAPGRPVCITQDGVEASYATEQEVLDFANKLREIGGADTLDALLPSQPQNPKSCLIANALNFGCRVDGIRDIQAHNKGPRGEHRWSMKFPANMSDERIQEIAAHVGLRIDTNGCDLVLPWHIGNAASAFDTRTGWTTKYVAPISSPDKWYDTGSAY